MIGSNLIVTIGDDDEGAQPADASAEEPQQFERGPIGPVRVLADDQLSAPAARRRPPARPRRAGARAALSRARPSIVRPSGGTDRAPERAERAWRARRTMCAALLSAGTTGEGVDQRGLAHPGFAAHEDQSPVPCGSLAQVLLELSEMLVGAE